MKWSKYNYEYKSSKHGNMLFNYLSGVFVDLNDEDTYNQFQLIKSKVDSFDFTKNVELKNFLIDNGIICEEERINEDVLYYQAFKSRAQIEYKTLTIVPTLGCNLACPYCYEGLDKKKISMSVEVVRAVKEYIKQYIVKGGTKLITLLWYGGEPLLEFGTIREITEYINSFDIPVYTDITTNGTLLTQKVLDQFDILKIGQIQLTFDGVQEDHDKKRVFKNGKGTFDLLMEKCEMLNSYVSLHPKFSAQIRINVDLSNKDKCVELFNTLKIKYPNLDIYFAPLKQYHSCSNTVNCFPNDAAVFEYLLSLYYDYGIDALDYKSVLRGLTPCMAECESSVIVGPSGEQYLCLRDVGDPKEVVGNILTKQYNPSIIAQYHSGRLTTHNLTCQKCDFFWMCGGGCPNSQYRNKNYHEENPVCPPLKQKKLFNKYLDMRYEINKNQK